MLVDLLLSEAVGLLVSKEKELKPVGLDVEVVILLKPLPFVLVIPGFLQVIVQELQVEVCQDDWHFRVLGDSLELLVVSFVLVELVHLFALVVVVASLMVSFPLLKVERLTVVDVHTPGAVGLEVIVNSVAALKLILLEVLNQLLPYLLTNLGEFVLIDKHVKLGVEILECLVEVTDFALEVF